MANCWPSSGSLVRRHSVRVWILRGITGSGKSQWWKARDWGNVRPLVCSADHFFHTGPEGAYEFNPAKIGLAHLTCKRRFLEGLQTSVPEIVVDNTNLTGAEMGFFVHLAELFGYEVSIVQFNCPTQLAADRTAHGVPAVVVGAMAETLRQEILPSWIKDRIVEHVWTGP